MKSKPELRQELQSLIDEMGIKINGMTIAPDRESTEEQCLQGMIDMLRAEKEGHTSPLNLEELDEPIDLLPSHVPTKQGRKATVEELGKYLEDRFEMFKKNE